MCDGQNPRLRITAGLLVVVAGFAMGCHSGPEKQNRHADPIYTSDLQLPRELQKVTHPTYTIEAPDILVIEATRYVPLDTRKIQPLDALYLSIPEEKQLPNEPVNGIYPVDIKGDIELSSAYGGSFRVTDYSVRELEAALTEHLRRRVREISIKVSLASSSANQVINGQHIVKADGTVGLGIYGSVYVAGMTMIQARTAVERHLTQFLYKPEISLDVYAFNSKYYYVITDFAGAGEQVVRLPITGNETVLDAVANIGGLSAVSSKKIWIARPAPAGCADQILPVDWKGVTRRGHTGSNYQILPGDRVYVMANPLNKIDTHLGRFLAPVERLFGTGLLIQGLVNPGAGLGNN
jgi:polysaccharide biosynthesis/export protein